MSLNRGDYIIYDDEIVEVLDTDCGGVYIEEESVEKGEPDLNFEEAYEYAIDYLRFQNKKLNQMLLVKENEEVYKRMWLDLYSNVDLWHEMSLSKGSTGIRLAFSNVLGQMHRLEESGSDRIK